MPTPKLLIVMSPIATIKPHKDTNFALLLAAKARGWETHVAQTLDIYYHEAQTHCHTTCVEVVDNASTYYQVHSTQDLPLSAFDLVLMRDDPPVTLDTVYCLELLANAVKAGHTRVANSPMSLLQINEKLFVTEFPEVAATTLITREAAKVSEFISQHQDVILKPLDGMGGKGIFRLTPSDPNTTSVIEALTDSGKHLIMVQPYLKAIETSGDKRILMINGQAYPYALARHPAAGQTRANLASGGQGEVVALTTRDKAIADAIGPTLKNKGLAFVGLDVIGSHVTEINVTSPTCVREIARETGEDIAEQILTACETVQIEA